LDVIVTLRFQPSPHDLFATRLVGARGVNFHATERVTGRLVRRATLDVIVTLRFQPSPHDLFATRLVGARGVNFQAGRLVRRAALDVIVTLRFQRVTGRLV
jgi:hypothetical protein